MFLNYLNSNLSKYIFFHINCRHGVSTKPNLDNNLQPFWNPKTQIITLN